MKRLLQYGDRYLRESSWKDIGLIKACLFSFGLLVGTYIPKGKKEAARVMALLGFAVTATLIMEKFFSVIREKDQ